ncbi:oligosaccharide flippase family protein [uncultured Pseudoalteromonas sp.]|mgnify:CR=1 FL=1|uniref:oligosaccharide flippase family protein n=1 Tax=uncultured Pseudoalteromonas sp. TaxID=114053 RepID=UPI002592AB32|nr:oligosaccharide flippase family protein [uncultured Pseudoalteromonas sp.]
MSIKFKTYIKGILEGGFWNVFSGGISKAAIAFSYIILARKLTPSLYGEFSVVQTNLVLLGTFTGIGLGSAAVKLISSSTSEYVKFEYVRKTLSISFATCFFISIFLLLFSENISTAFVGNTSLSLYLLISIPLLIFTTFYSLFNSILIAYKNYKLNASLNILNGLVVSILFYFLEINSISEAIYVLEVSYIIPTFIFFCWYYNIKKNSRNRVKNKLVTYNEIFSICIPITISSILVVPTTWLVSLLLTNLNPNGVIELGLYNAANQWRNIITFIPVMLAPITLSLLTGVEFSTYSMKLKLLINTLISTLIAMCVCAFIYLFRGFFETAYGEGYVGISSLIVLISLASCLIVFNNSIGQFLIAVNKVRIGVFFNLIWAAAFIVLTYLLVDDGAQGVVTALIYSYLIHSLFQITYCYKVLFHENSYNL